MSTPQGPAADDIPEKERSRLIFDPLIEIDQLLYCSLATHPMSEQEINELVQRSSERNATEGITGMLMYSDGVFVQLLEGPKDALSRVWNRVLHDGRHFGVVKLMHRSEVEMRCCGNWTMRYTDQETLRAIVHEARTELAAGRKSRWAHAIELMDTLLTKSDWVAIAETWAKGSQAHPNNP